MDFAVFFIESKFFQLVVEEGGNLFSLKIFEQGKYFTFRKGDTAYTVQRGSNQFGQYLSVIELKVGGRRRTIVNPCGKGNKVGGCLGLNYVDY